LTVPPSPSDNVARHELTRRGLRKSRSGKSSLARFFPISLRESIHQALQFSRTFAETYAIGDLIKFLGLAFSALLPLINPVGDALVLLSLVGNAPPTIYRMLARRIAISTTIFLILIEAGGTLVLRFFGISLPVVQVSGGLTLAAMGWRLLNQEEPHETETPTEVDGTDIRSLEQKIFYPFTFPLTAGPGCIVVMVTLSAHASGKRLLPSLMAHTGIAIAVLLLSVGVYLCYGHAPKITERISPQTVHGILRLIAFVLLCIGVQITSNGVEAMAKAMH